MTSPRVIFVFGSNVMGQHDGGAARDARLFWGAAPGVGEGLTGESYALPTIGPDFQRLPLPAIAAAVGRFVRCAADHPALTFYVTPIGCGIAGYAPDDIAPLFADVPHNVQLPKGWPRGTDNRRGAPIVYIAARGEDQPLAVQVRARLSLMGIRTTARWIGQSLANESHAEAAMDIEDVRAAQILVLLKPRASHRQTTGGHHVETGIALERRMPILLLGDIENVFHHHDSVVRLPWPENERDWGAVSATLMSLRMAVR